MAFLISTESNNFTTNYFFSMFEFENYRLNIRNIKYLTTSSHKVDKTHWCVLFNCCIPLLIFNRLNLLLFDLMKGDFLALE